MTTRREFLRKSVAAVVLPWGFTGRGPDEDPRVLLAAAEELDAAPARIIASDPQWESRLRRLIHRAESLTRRRPHDPAAWYTAARCRWVDVDAELESGRALTCVERALKLSPHHGPALVLGEEIARFTALVFDDAALRRRSAGIGAGDGRRTDPLHRAE